MACEQRKAVFVALHVFGVARHDHFHEVFGRAVTALALNKHFIDIAVIKIADRTLDQIAFLINRGGRHRFQGKRADLLPKALQIFVIALDLRFGALGTRGAHDKASAFWYQNLVGNFFELLAIRRVGDLAADPTAPSGIWHQDAIAPRKRQIRGQRSTLVAAFFFYDLHQKNLANIHDFLDFIAARARFAHRTHIFTIVFFCNRFDTIIFGRCINFRIVAFVSRFSFFGSINGFAGIIFSSRRIIRVAFCVGSTFRVGFGLRRRFNLLSLWRCCICSGCIGFQRCIR